MRARLREGVKADRTACVNRIRGLLLEFGVAVPTGARALQTTLDDILEDVSNELNGLARLRTQLQWRELDDHLAWCDERLAAQERDNEQVQQGRATHGCGHCHGIGCDRHRG